MLATPTVIKGRRSNGPRPINLRKDVSQILHLMDLAFGKRLDGRQRRVLSDRISLSYQAPFALRLSMWTRGFVPGFVWDEDGRVVGNLTLLESQVPHRYLIANVAVHPDYRRQGIARALMGEAIRHVHQRKGDKILLQVETENESAINLYDNLGFITLGVTSRWESTSSRLRPLPSDRDRQTKIRSMKRGDWRPAYYLDKSVVHPDLNWPVPPTSGFYRRGFWRWFDGLINGRSTRTWVSETLSPQDGQRYLVGLASVESDWGRPYELRLRIKPSWRNRLARPLLDRAIRSLKRSRAAKIIINHPSNDDCVTPLLEEANFERRRLLSVMSLQLEEA